MSDRTEELRDAVIEAAGNVQSWWHEHGEPVSEVEATMCKALDELREHLAPNQLRDAVELLRDAAREMHGLDGMLPAHRRQTSTVKMHHRIDTFLAALDKDGAT